MRYKQVIQDYQNGTIDRRKWQVCFDNDGGYWSYIGDPIPEAEEERLRKEMEEKYGDTGGYQDLVDLANAAGINAEWV